MRLLISARRFINGLAPDVVHAHYSVTHGMICAIARVRPYVLSVWGTDVVVTAGGLRGRFLSRLNRMALRQAAAVTSTSAFMIPHIKRHAGEPIDVAHVPFGVDTDQFTPDHHRSRNGAFTVGYVKHLKAKYGPADLVEAFGTVATEIPGSKLIMAGSGDLSSQLVNHVDRIGLGDHVNFLGRVDHNDVAALMQSFDVLVNPTVVPESFGVVILEAAATGLPAVVTDVGGVGETAVDGETAVFVEPGRPDQLATALIHLARHPEERARLGKAGRRRVESHFSWDGNVEAMLRVLGGAAGVTPR